MNINRSLKLGMLAMASVLILWACGGSGSAQAVAERFLDAMAHGDLAAAKKDASKDAQTALDMLASNVAPKKDNPAKIEQVVATENGDKATVTYIEDGIAQHMDMVKEGGAWKVAWTKGDGGQQAFETSHFELEAAMDAASAPDTTAADTTAKQPR